MSFNTNVGYQILIKRLQLTHSKHKFIFAIWLCDQIVTEMCSYISEISILIDLTSFNNWNICWVLILILTFLLSYTLANNKFFLLFVLKWTENFSCGWIISHFFHGWTGKRAPWSCVSQSHFLCNVIHTGGLRKIFIFLRVLRSPV